MRPTVARAWHLVTAVVSVGALVVQIVLVVRGVNVLTEGDSTTAVSIGTKLYHFFCYFTIQSNIALSWGAILLFLDPNRDGRGFRVLRMAGLVGITLTFVVYLTVLLSLITVTGAGWVTDRCLHVSG